MFTYTRHTIFQRREISSKRNIFSYIQIFSFSDTHSGGMGRPAKRRWCMTYRRYKTKTHTISRRQQQSVWEMNARENSSRWAVVTCKHLMGGHKTLIIFSSVARVKKTSFSQPHIFPPFQLFFHTASSPWQSNDFKLNFNLLSLLMSESSDESQAEIVNGDEWCR